MLLAACSLGAAAGLLFAWLWLRVVPHSAHLRFWGAMQPIAREVLQAERLAQLIALYRRLGALVGRYVARNVCGVLLAGIPVALVFVVNDEAAFIAAFALASTTGMLWPRRS